MIRNKHRQGLVKYWWTGRYYPLIKGYQSKRKGIWDKEARDGVPFEGSVFKASLTTAINGKLRSWKNLLRMSTWNRLFDLMAICKEEKVDED